jgi:hypothetical protein
VCSGCTDGEIEEERFLSSIARRSISSGCVLDGMDKLEKTI